MKKNMAKVAGDKICIPSYFERMRKAPGELRGFNPHEAQTENARCILIFDRIENTDAFDYDQQSLVDEMHAEHLMDNQGLVAAERGSVGGRQYLYTIVKTLDTDDITAGVQYDLTLLLDWKDGATRIQGTFVETGVTGMRDSMVLAMRSSEAGGMTAAMEGWREDPYDPLRKEGALMNVSEREEYDTLFPNHPLSIARDVVRCALGLNTDPESEIGSADEDAEASERKGFTPIADAAGALFGKVAGAAGGLAEKAGSAASAAAETASGAADSFAKAAGGAIDAIGGKVEEIRAAKDEPDEYDKAVIAYNMAYTDLSDSGLELHGQRVRAIDLIGHVEGLVNSIANHPKSFDADLGEISTHKGEFKSTEDFARKELAAARASATGAGAGVAAGMAVASMAPSAALWVATTFGTASTGTAISTLSGAAATQAALAWLGGGTLAAGGGGAAAGSALLAMAGPIGWGIAGATLLTSIVLFAKSKFDIRDEKQKELTAVKLNTERVSEMAAEVGALLTKTVGLRDRLSELYDTCAPSFGSDFSKLSQDKQDGLASMVNNTLALSRLLNERLTQDDE